MILSAKAATMGPTTPRDDPLLSILDRFTPLEARASLPPSKFVSPPGPAAEPIMRFVRECHREPVPHLTPSGPGQETLHERSAERHPDAARRAGAERAAAAVRADAAVAAFRRRLCPWQTLCEEASLQLMRRLDLPTLLALKGTDRASAARARATLASVRWRTTGSNGADLAARLPEAKAAGWLRSRITPSSDFASLTARALRAELEVALSLPPGALRKRRAWLDRLILVRRDETAAPPPPPPPPPRQPSVASRPAERSLPAPSPRPPPQAPPRPQPKPPPPAASPGPTPSGPPPSLPLHGAAQPTRQARRQAPRRRCGECAGCVSPGCGVCASCRGTKSAIEQRKGCVHRKCEVLALARREAAAARLLLQAGSPRSAAAAPPAAKTATPRPAAPPAPPAPPATPATPAPPAPPAAPAAGFSTGREASQEAAPDSDEEEGRPLAARAKKRARGDPQQAGEGGRGEGGAGGAEGGAGSDSEEGRPLATRRRGAAAGKPPAKANASESPPPPPPPPARHKLAAVRQMAQSSDEEEEEADTACQVLSATVQAARAQVASGPSGAMRAAAVMRLVRHCHRRPVQHLPGPIPFR